MKLGSVKRRLAMFCVNHIFAGTRDFEIKRKLLGTAGFEIGEGTKVVGPMICTGSLKVGRNCWMGRDLTDHGNGSVEIGDNCDIALAVMFLTGGHAIDGPERRAGKGENYTIRVGNSCWIGARATLGRSICIGEGSVIAACACGMSNVEENALVGGVPARTIRKLEL